MRAVPMASHYIEPEDGVLPPSMPRSGNLTSYGKKILAQMFMFIASGVVLGTAASGFPGERLRRDTYMDTPAGASYNEAYRLCIFYIILGTVSTIITLMLVVINFLVELDMRKREGIASFKSESVLMYFLAVWWLAGVGTLSSNSNDLSANQFSKVDEQGLPYSGNINVFGWLNLIATLYGAFQIWRVRQEEKLYDELTREWEADVDRKMKEKSNKPRVMP